MSLAQPLVADGKHKLLVDRFVELVELLVDRPSRQLEDVRELGHRLGFGLRCGHESL